MAAHAVDEPALVEAGIAIFRTADKNNGGALSKKELKNKISTSPELCVQFGFKHGHFSQKHFAVWFKSVDKDDDGIVTTDAMGRWLRHHADHHTRHSAHQASVDAHSEGGREGQHRPGGAWDFAKQGPPFSRPALDRPAMNPLAGRKCPTVPTQHATPPVLILSYPFCSTTQIQATPK